MPGVSCEVSEVRSCFMLDSFSSCDRSPRLPVYDKIATRYTTELLIFMGNTLQRPTMIIGRQISDRIMFSAARTPISSSIIASARRSLRH